MPPKAFLEGGEVAHEYAVAYRLRKTVAEIHEMDNHEFVRWTRFLGVMAQTQELEAKQASARAGG